MKIDLSGMALPSVFKRDAVDCFFDPYRKRLIQITPEEIVRQKVLVYLEEVLLVPQEMIQVEIPMSHYSRGEKGRADIVIHKPLPNGDMEVLAVVECKQEDVVLSDNVAYQACRYSDLLASSFFIVTNGTDLEMAQFINGANEYRWLDDIVNYPRMISADSEQIQHEDVARTERSIERFTMEQLADISFITEYNDNKTHWIFGHGTPPIMRTFIVNFYQCLMDESHILPKSQRASYEMVQDLGIRFSDYSNAGGGHYIGYYRAFLVNDKDGNAQIISMSLFGTNPDYENASRNSYCYFLVAVDKYKVSHSCLQYNIDRYLHISENSAIFFHNGQISSRPAKPLLDLVFKRSNTIMPMKSGLSLGTIPTNKLLYLDDPDVSNTIMNVIEYALIREEYTRETKITH